MDSEIWHSQWRNSIKANGLEESRIKRSWEDACWAISTVRRSQTIVMCIWANRKWGSYIGVFEMCDHHFLFEFPTKIMAEHTLTGDWSGKRKHYICHGGLRHLVAWRKIVDMPELGLEYWASL